MGQSAIFLLSSLPVLSPPPEPAAFDSIRFIDLIGDDPSRPLVAAVLVIDDLLLADSHRHGVAHLPTPVVLSPPQVHGEEPFDPDWEDGPEEDLADEHDDLWAGAFRRTWQTGRTLRSPFLRHWAVFEVGLRNALVRERAQRLGLEAGPRLLARELEEHLRSQDLAAIDAALAAVRNATTPLAAQQGLDLTRWAWLDDESRFDFDRDGLPLYAARLSILARAQRSQGATASGAAT